MPDLATYTAPPSGLSGREAARRLSQAGPNVPPHATRGSPWALLGRQLTHFFALLLWGAAVLAVVAGMPQPGIAIAIAIVVLVNGAFAFAQEYRADRAAERLRSLMPATATASHPRTS